jgi:hypothetical protein
MDAMYKVTVDMADGGFSSHTSDNPEWIKGMVERLEVGDRLTVQLVSVNGTEVLDAERPDTG